MQVFKVEGMTCGHCVRAVTEAIQRMDGDAQVDVDMESGKVSVDSELPADRIMTAIREEGYSVEAA